MNHPLLPATVIHDLINNYLTCHDQLKTGHVLKDYLDINEQILATILRSSYHICLKNLFDPLITKSFRYVKEPYRVSVRQSVISWPYNLPQSFDLNTFNKVWVYHSTHLFQLYTRLFSYSPFVYQPNYTLVDIFDVPCKFL
jgi:hypothetical protein